MALEILITSGGTITKIDDVRHLGNFSSGTTGSLIAEEFLKNNAIVHYLYGKNAKRPFREDLKMNPRKPKNEELDRLSRAYDIFNKYAINLREYSITTFDEYHNQVKNILKGKSINVAILAAAVGDYSYSQKEGKISSDEDKLTLEFNRNPKIISLIKEWNPEVYQIGFKLLSRVSEDKLIDMAYKNAINNDSDITVANCIFGDFDLTRVKTFLVFRDRTYREIKRENLASNLVEEVRKRFSQVLFYNPHS